MTEDEDKPGGGGATTITTTPDLPGPRPVATETVAQIDPRLKARRKAVKKEAGRRRLKLMVLGIAVAGLLVAAVIATRSPLLEVRTVRVQGVVYADPGTVQSVVAGLQGDPLLEVDTAKVRRTLESIPWVKRAEVSKRWPHTVQISVVERRPVASFYSEDNQYRIVDDLGRVLVALPGYPVDYVPIAGAWPATAPGGTVTEPLLSATRLAGALPDTLKARTTEIRTDASGLTLMLNPKGRILLGPTDDLRAKLVSALAVLNQADPAKISTIDVRVPAKPVLTEQGT